ncbi:MAG: carboxypeptidase regulatory-like domain-containing protein [Singulisphaera sp.]
MAVSDADGRFQFELDKASSTWPYDDEPPWHKAQVAASAPGLGLAWVEAGSLADGGEATLQLVRDDVPIHGRVLDTQGRPVAGVSVRLGQVGVLKDGVDLDAMLASGEVDHAQTSEWYGYDEAIWPGGQNTWTTDADGRFEVKSIGHDRLAKLHFQSPALADGNLYVMARPAKAPPKPKPRPNRRPGEMSFNASYGLPPGPRLVGATFEHFADLSKPITGVVRLKGTGKPLGGVMVIGHEAATMTRVSARTDAEGRFRLAGLPKGELYQIQANPRSGVDPFLRAMMTITDTEGLKPIETILELPRGVIVTGRLVDDGDGRPVWASEVRSSNLPTNPNEGDGTSGHWSLTDPTFRLTVPPGEGMLIASARGRETPYVRARLSKAEKGKGVGGRGDGETVTTQLNAYHTCKIFDVPDTAESFSVELKLTRGLSRKGRVVGPDGKPVTGAQCYGLISTWGYVKTLEEDTFEVLGLETDYPRQLVFAHEGRRLVGSVIIKGEDAKDEAPIEVRLVPPGSVKGRLLDEGGLPLSDAKLWVMSYDLNGGNLPPGRLWPDGSTFIQPNGWLFSTDADGRFRVVGLKPGIKSSIGVDKKTRPNYQLDTRGVLLDIVLQHPGEVRDLGDVTVKESPIR